MVDSPIVKMDQGAVNDRILAKEVKAGFRRVEAASVKMMTRFASAEAKRLFVRYFSTLQLNAHFVSVIARTKLKPEDVERVEGRPRRYPPVPECKPVRRPVAEAISGGVR